MKKVINFLKVMFLGFLSMLGFTKNHNPAFSSMTSGFAPNYSNYIGVVKKVTELNSAMVEQFSYSLTNTTGKNLNVALTRPSMLNVQRTVVPDASGNVVANGTGLVAVTGTAPLIVYDNVSKFANVRTVDTVVGDGITDTTGDNVLYKDSTGKLTILANNLPVSYFLNQINEDQLIIESLDISVNDPAVYRNASLIINFVNSFNKSEERIIKLKDFENIDNTKDKIIKVNITEKLGWVLQLDKKTLVTLVMPGLVNGVANSFIDIQFNVKSIKDTDKEMIEAVLTEYKTMQKTGQPSEIMKKVLEAEAFRK